MKKISFVLEDEEYDKINAKKQNKTWVEFITQMVEDA